MHLYSKTVVYLCVCVWVILLVFSFSFTLFILCIISSLPFPGLWTPCGVGASEGCRAQRSVVHTAPRRSIEPWASSSHLLSSAMPSTPTQHAPVNSNTGQITPCPRDCGRYDCCRWHRNFSGNYFWKLSSCKDIQHSVDWIRLGW